MFTSGTLAPAGDLDMYLFVSNNEIKNLVDEFSITWEQLINDSDDKKLIKSAKGYRNRVKTIYKDRGFIYGYLIIKYDPEHKKYFIMDNDRKNPNYTSSLVNFNATDEEPQASFDITIKDSSIDLNGTPPYITFNL